MQCSTCGAQVRDDAKFCTSCGAPMSASPTAPSEAQTTASDEFQARWPFIAGAIGLVIVGLVVGLVLVTGGSDDSDAPSAKTSPPKTAPRQTRPAQTEPPQTAPPRTAPPPTAAPATFAASELNGVTCASPSTCFAVGSSFGKDGYYTAGQTLIQRWDGTDWSVVASPSPAGARYSELIDVACPSPRSCFAVGVSTTGPGNGVRAPLTEHWDGSNWSIMTTPALPSGTQGSLHGVACTSDRGCFAVGDETTKPLAELWDGTTWTIVPSGLPAGADSSYLWDVACSLPDRGVLPTRAASKCLAVGGASPSGGSIEPMVQQWQGTSWSIIASPSGEASLAGVACLDETSCVAVGAASGLPESAGGLVAQWDGANWAIIPTPYPASTDGYIGALASVACSNTASCTSVGNVGPPEESTPLVEQWDGATWSAVTVPAAPGSSDLRSVACPSTTVCFAVGAANGDTFEGRPLIEQWDGTSWSEVSS